jgi:hypothetical protein
MGKLRNNTEWTINTLKVLMDERFASQEKAIVKAEDANEKRFEGVNEFRNQLKDQAATFITRSEHDTLVDSVKKLEEFRAQNAGYYQRENTGRVQNNWAVGLLVTVVLSIVILVVNFIKH